MATRAASLLVLRVAVVVVAAVLATWMAFDGSRALVVGDYVTPSTGASAGRLGPWAGVVEAAGIAPRSTLMKSILAGYGWAWIGLILLYAAEVRGTRSAMAAAAAGALWYLPFGTFLALVVLVLAVVELVRSGSREAVA